MGKTYMIDDVDISVSCIERLDQLTISNLWLKNEAQCLRIRFYFMCSFIFWIDFITVCMVCFDLNAIKDLLYIAFPYKTKHIDGNLGRFDWY